MDILLYIRNIYILPVLRMFRKTDKKRLKAIFRNMVKVVEFVGTLTALFNFFCQLFF